MALTKNELDSLRIKDIKILIDEIQHIFDDSIGTERFNFNNIRDPHRELSAELEKRMLEEIKNRKYKSDSNFLHKFRIYFYKEFWNGIIEKENEKHSLKDIWKKYKNILKDTCGEFGCKYLIPTLSRFKKWSKEKGIPDSNSDLTDLLLVNSDVSGEISPNLPNFIPIDVKSKEISKWKNSNGISITRFYEWCLEYDKWFKNIQPSNKIAPPPPLIYIEARHQNESGIYCVKKISVREIRQLRISKSGSSQDGWVYPNPAQNQMQFSPGEHSNDDLPKTCNYIKEFSERVIPIFERKIKKVNKEIKSWENLK